MIQAAERTGKTERKTARQYSAEEEGQLHSNIETHRHKLFGHLPAAEKRLGWETVGRGVSGATGALGRSVSIGRLPCIGGWYSADTPWNRKWAYFSLRRKLENVQREANVGLSNPLTVGTCIQW